MLALLVPTWITAAAVAIPPPPPCGFLTTEVTVLGPRGEETGVPLNTSLWFHLRNVPARAVPLTVELRADTATTTVPVRIETVFELERDSGEQDGVRRSALRVVPTEELRPGTRYQFTWNAANDAGQEAFTTGTTRDDQAPDAPASVRVGTSNERPGCTATLALTVRHDGDPGLLYLPTVGGAPRGLARGDAVEALIGEASTPVVGGLVAIDLAGNRSADGAQFSGTTQDACASGVCERVDRSSSCATTGGGDPRFGAVVAGLFVLALRRRRGD